MKTAFLVTSLYLGFGLTWLMARPEYGARIPNSEHPLFLDSKYQLNCRLCHTNSTGAGARNAFGETFENHGGYWNAAFAQEDSDGDGRSNGLELGDPGGLWKPSDPNPQVTPTHPSISDSVPPTHIRDLYYKSKHLRIMGALNFGSEEPEQSILSAATRMVNGRNSIARRLAAGMRLEGRSSGARATGIPQSSHP